METMETIYNNLKFGKKYGTIAKGNNYFTETLYMIGNKLYYRRKSTSGMIQINDLKSFIGVMKVIFAGMTAENFSEKYVCLSVETIRNL